MPEEAETEVIALLDCARERPMECLTTWRVNKLTSDNAEYAYARARTGPVESQLLRVSHGHASDVVKSCMQEIKAAGEDSGIRDGLGQKMLNPGVQSNFISPSCLPVMAKTMDKYDTDAPWSAMQGHQWISGDETYSRRLCPGCGSQTR